MLSRFRWTTFDVSDLLPPGWRQDVAVLAAAAEFRLFPRTPVVSRETADVSHVPRGRVHADQVLLFCFHYDPVTGRYGRVALGAVRVAGVATVVAIFSLIGAMLWREAHRPRGAGPGARPA